MRLSLAVRIVHFIFYSCNCNTLHLTVMLISEQYADFTEKIEK